MADIAGMGAGSVPEVGAGVQTRMIFLWVSVGFLAGFLFCLLAIFTLAQNASVQTALQRWFISHSLTQLQQASEQVAPVVQGAKLAVPAVSSTSTIAASTTAGTPQAIIVPKSKGSQESFQALNAAVTQLNSLSSGANDLTGLLLQIQAQSLTGKMDGLLPLMYKAKDLVQKERSMSVTLSADLGRLDQSAQSEADTKSHALMITVATTGDAFVSSFNRYLSGVDILLAGTPPTSAQVKNVQDYSKDVETKSGAFVGAIGILVDYFGVQKISA